MGSSTIETSCINAIRVLAMDAVQKANSGHPGLPMGGAPMAFALWTRHLKHNPRHPRWFDRDRFILSAGHGSMLLYALLHLTGYDMTLDDLKAFRQWGSRTPGHPENHITPGVEMATGPLGQGLSTAVGMAMAERFLAATFNRPGHTVVDHHTYVICSDGDLMEGVTNEACSLAGHHRLGKLIALYDDNKITIDGSTAIAFTEDVLGRFAALGWHVDRVEDGNDWQQVDAAIRRAKAVTDRPSLISCPTTIGYGSPNKAGTSKVHGAPLGPDEVAATKKNLGVSEEPFFVPDEVRIEFGKAISAGEAAEREWEARMSAYAAAYPAEAAALREAIDGKLPAGWPDALPELNEKLATRQANQKTLNALAPAVPLLIGGSADLSESNLTHLPGSPSFQPDTPEGRNIAFGVREHGMAAAVNGMNLHGGVRAYGATFLIFSDYCRASIRLAALMQCPSIFVFTHDSIGLGEDGPTHQPVEHLASLRAIPNLNLMRPADALETAACWGLALERTDGPSVLALTRQGLPPVTSGKPSEHPARRGAYVLAESSGATPRVVLVATGSEVQLALVARELLEADGVPTRVVNMPSWFLFERQDAGYRESVLPKSVPTVSVEAGATFGWAKYAQAHVGLDRFGASAPGDVLFREFGFTAENVAETARRLIGG
ncbi:MAG: transketolase [Fimbriimonadaceae bacterium]